MESELSKELGQRRHAHEHTSETLFPGNSEQIQQQLININYDNQSLPVFLEDM